MEAGSLKLGALFETIRLLLCGRCRDCLVSAIMGIKVLLVLLVRFIPTVKALICNQAFELHSKTSSLALNVCIYWKIIYWRNKLFKFITFCLIGHRKMLPLNISQFLEMCFLNVKSPGKAAGINRLAGLRPPFVWRRILKNKIWFLASTLSCWLKLDFFFNFCGTKNRSTTSSYKKKKDNGMKQRLGLISIDSLMLSVYAVWNTWRFRAHLG